MDLRATRVYTATKIAMNAIKTTAEPPIIKSTFWSLVFVAEVYCSRPRRVCGTSETAHERTKIRLRQLQWPRVLSSGGLRKRGLPHGLCILHVL